MRVRFFACLGILGLAIAAAGAAEPLTSRNFSVIDGNRLEIGGREIRLAGIVAPELGQACLLYGKRRDCGLVARSGLLDLTAGATVTCMPASEVDGAAAYRCTAGGYDLSEGMVYTGWAVPLEGAPQAYWRVLDGARARPRGFWRGEFVEPWAPVLRVSGEQ
jgi:endonuclease YncB( thermonuclease family)